MNRPVISPAFCAASSPEHTLEVMQKRLQMAEDETKKLVTQLEDYGFSKEIHERKNDKGGKIEPISSFKLGPGSTQMDVLQKNYDQMVSRVCRSESTIQSLKLAMCSLQAERDLSGLRKSKEIEIPKDTYDREIKALEKKLSRCKQELENNNERRLEAESAVQRLKNSLDKASNFSNETKVKVEELKNDKQKLSKKVNELKEELSREQQMRSSLEQSHTTLLQRVNDMDRVVETERGDVQALAAECQELKREASTTKEEYNKERKMRLQLETLVTQLQEDSANTDAELGTLRTEKRAAHEKVYIEHKQVSEELRAATVDNKVLLSQQREALQRERQAMSMRLAEQDRALDMAKQALVIEVEEERARLMAVDRERSKLKEEIFKLQSDKKVAEGDKEKLKLKIEELKLNLEQTNKEKELVMGEKGQILEEIKRTVDGFSQERNRIEQQLRDAGVEIERLQQRNGVMERECQAQLDRIVELENQQHLGRHQIEEAMKDMVEAKNRLAYEKGSLQSRVEHLNKELSAMGALKVELEHLRKENTTAQNHYKKVLSELQSCRTENQELQGRLHQLELNSGMRDSDLRAVITSRDEALREVEKLVHHTEALERNYQNKIESLQRAFNEARENNCRLTSTTESLMGSHAELQATLENMQTELGRRDSELKSVTKERNAAFERVQDLQYELDSLHNRLAGLENSEQHELRPLREAVKSAKNDHQELTQKLERAMQTNSKLQSTAERLQMELGRKDVELEKLIKDR
ncbi:predicted protein [Nematostella vectensis]|uniref:Uncharacterized protein n=1 Tax=Nematostella vectensis TaxID=45351 RepID=A7S9U7_NEMVE|nr:predicted protein [Nematostella vectensis]|eukprot:XP_001631548.1 predicted protein [Nematostella vectensis]